MFAVFLTMQRSILISNGASGQALFIPQNGGMVLTTDLSAPLGVTWRQPAPAVVSGGPSNITVEGVQCDAMDLTASFDTSRVLPNGVIQFTQNHSNFQAVIQKTYRLRTLQLSEFGGQMLTQNMIFTNVIPPCSRPPAAITSTVLVSNQGIKSVGCIMVSPNGTIEIWPTITKNINAWIVSPYYVEGFTMSWIVAA